METESLDTTRLLLPIHDEDHVHGPASADFTLVEYGDYECPDCGRLFQIIRDLQATLGSRLQIVYRHYPLNGIHPEAQEAAEAAEAAGGQNRFWEMHDLLYENQDLWKDDINPKTIFLKFAADLGLETARFARDMDDKQVKLRIEADQEVAAELGINSTPTVLIDGRQLRP